MKQVDGGWLVKTEAGWDVYVLAMIFNYRIAISHEGDTYGWEAAWCYQGNGIDTFAQAVVAAEGFHDLDHGEPVGYFKCAGDRR
jgi:hypothetical protein